MCACRVAPCPASEPPAEEDDMGPQKVSCSCPGRGNPDIDAREPHTEHPHDNEAEDPEPQGRMCRVPSCPGREEHHDEADPVLQRDRSVAVGEERCYSAPPDMTLCQRVKWLQQLWIKVCNDPFRWQLFKSITYFTIGLKLFSDVFAYMNPPPEIGVRPCR